MKNYHVRIKTKNDYVIIKEVEARNEWEAVLLLDDRINYDLGLYFSDKDYKIEMVTEEK